MQTNDLTWHFGYVSVLLLAAGLTFVVLKWPRGIQYTFSQHVAARRSSAAFYSLLFLITLPLLFVFFYTSFIPQFHLPLAFTVMLAISCLAQILCTFVPERGKTKTTIHRVLAGISALCLPILLALIALTSTVSLASKVISLIALLAMCIFLALAAFTKLRSTHALILQVVYNVAFFVPILIACYI